MRIFVPTALAVAAILAAAGSGPAEARCLRASHQVTCGHHRLHAAAHASRGPRLAAYGYRYPYYYGSAYLYSGSGYPYSGSSSYGAATIGPAPSSSGGP